MLEKLGCKLERSGCCMKGKSVNTEDLWDCCKPGSLANKKAMWANKKD